jgi:hypothetical protein
MKNKLLFSLLLFTFAVYACSENEEPATEDVAPVIRLIAPENNEIVDLGANPLNFEWDFVTGVVDYKVLIGVSPDLSGSSEFIVPVNNNFLSLTAGDLSGLLDAAGIGYESLGTLYWMVKSTDGEKSSAKRAVTVSRPTPVFSLLSPDNAAAIVLNHSEPTDHAVTFSWETIPNAVSYDLLVSYDSNLSNPLNIARTKGITATQITFGDAELQALIQQQILQKRYVDNLLYWNVKETGSGKYVAAEPRSLKLGGYRQFVDTRGDEVITYDVSVITYGNRQHVWLSQNLRTARAVDGTPIENIPVDGYISSIASVPITSPLDWAYADLAKVKSFGTVPESMEPYLGNWYANLAIDVWRDHLTPAGWKIPTWDEMKALFEAAHEAASDIRVLKNLAGYDTYNPDGTWNSWNMNMVPNGCGNWNVCPNVGSGWGLAKDYQGLYFMIDDGPGVTNLFDSWNGLVNAKWGAGSWCGLPVRLRYIGDE